MTDVRKGCEMRVGIETGYPQIEVIVRCPEASDEVDRIVATLHGPDKLSGIKKGNAVMGWL